MINNISIAKTQKYKDSGTPNVVHVAISRSVRYDIMIAYGGHGGDEMLKAARFKKKRLEAQYPNGVVIGPKIFKTLDEFKRIWTEINHDVSVLNKSGRPKYDLHEVHIFAHSNPERISIRKGEHITMDVVSSLEKLTWNSSKGYLVLHSCRSGRYEGDDIYQTSGNECIARAFSESQSSAYVIGQMVYASFNYAPQNMDLKFRTSINDYIAIEWLDKNELVLWGYKSGSKVKKRFEHDKEYLVLSNGQIWPCRKFRNGQQLERTVSNELYNYDDLNFI